MEGIVIKGYSGFYYVEVAGELWECSLRGRFKLDKINVLAGDRVVIKPRHGRSGVVVEVLPRRNELVRPPVANVDRAVIITALKHPDPSTILLDRFLVYAEAARVQPVIVFNKADLNVVGEGLDLETIYKNIGYSVLVTSTKGGQGVDELRGIVREGVSVFAGASGVGKSSLLNCLQPGLKLKTGELGAKLKRGRHTTRHVELIAIEGGGLVVDTPGFSSLYMPEIKREELGFLFPEFDQYYTHCRFNGCLHNQEPDCAVRQAVLDNNIEPHRHKHYLEFLAEVIEQERSYK